MKVKFWFDSGANIHSSKELILDVEKDLGFTEQEWIDMSNEDKESVVWETMLQYADYGWEEVEE